MAVQIRPYVEGGSVSFPKRDLSKGPPIGMWTVVSFAGRVASGEAYWRCCCECGTERVVSHGSLRCGKSVSCGCIKAENTRKRCTTHGKCGTAEYAVWEGMIQRCYSEGASGFKDYGRRGITVCDAWRNSFAVFLRDMGEKPTAGHSIDRFPDNNGNYEPGNCRWATREQQQNNMRSNRPISCNGEVRNLTQWSRHAGIPLSTLSKRLGSGMPVVEALRASTKDTK